MYPTVEQLKENKRRQAKRQSLYVLILAFVFFALILMATGNMSLGKIPVFIQAIIVYSLLDIEPLRKMLGELERPKRSKFNLWFSSIFAAVLFIPVVLFILDASNELLTNVNLRNFKWENLLILTPGPLLLTLIRQLALKKDDELNKRIILSISKKITMSSICLIGFFPIILIVNKMGINPALIPEFSKPEYWVIGIFFWSATFMFYTGAILLLFSIGDIFSLLEEGK